MRKRSVWKRGVAAILSLAMVTTLFPSMKRPLVVQAAETVRSVNLYVNGQIAGISNPTDASEWQDTEDNRAKQWSGSYVNFGTYKSKNGAESVKFRVLNVRDTQAWTLNKTLLDCDTAFPATQYPGDSVADAIAYKEESGEITPGIQLTEIEKQKAQTFSLLDSDSVQKGTYGYAPWVDQTKTREKSFVGGSGQAAWYLKKSTQTNFVDTAGDIATDTGATGISPAFYLDMTSVFFTCAGQKDKFAATTEVDATASDVAWNLTWKDTTSSAPFVVQEDTMPSSIYKGGSCTITIQKPDTQWDTESYNQISALLTDTNNVVVAYGKIADIPSWSETVTKKTITIPIPFDIQSDADHFTLQILAEKVNETGSDYAHSVITRDGISVVEAPTLTLVDSTPSVTFNYTGSGAIQNADGNSVDNTDTATAQVAVKVTDPPNGFAVNTDSFSLVTTDDQTNLTSTDPEKSICWVSAATSPDADGNVTLTLSEGYYYSSRNSYKTADLYYGNTKLGTLQINRSYRPKITLISPVTTVYDGQGKAFDTNSGEHVTITLEGKTLTPTSNELIYRYYKDNEQIGQQNETGKADQLPSDLGDYDVTVTFKSDDDTNRTEVTSSKATFKITKQTLTIGLSKTVFQQETDFTDDMKKYTVVSSPTGLDLTVDSASWAKDDTYSGATDTYKYVLSSIVLKDADGNDVTDKYTIGSTSVVITIKPQKRVKITASDSNPTIEYNSNLIDVRDYFSCTLNEESYSIQDLDVVEYSVETPTGLSAGETAGEGSFSSTEKGRLNVMRVGVFSIKAKVTEDDEYTATEASIKLIVTKTKGTVNVTVTGAKKDADSDTPYIYYGDSYTFNPTSSTNTIDGIKYKYEKKTENNYVEQNEKPEELGVYRVTATFAETERYAETSATYIYEIRKRPITIKAKDQRILYGQSYVNGIEAIEEVKNLLPGDEVTEVTVNRAATPVTGDVDIIPEAARIQVVDANNTMTDRTAKYDITYQKGTLTIVPLEFEVTAENVAKEYDGKEYGITVETKPTDGVTVLYEKEPTSGTALQTTHTYTETASPKCREAGIYTIYYQVTKEGYATYEGSATVTINPRPVTITALPQELTWESTLNWDISKVAVAYTPEGSTVTNTGVNDGLIAGDEITNLTLTASPTTVTDAGTITPSGENLEIKRDDKVITLNYKIVAWVANRGGLVIKHNTNLSPILTAEKTQTIYETKEELNTDDIVLTVTYVDGYADPDITTGFTLDTSSVDMNSTGTYTLTLSYEDKTYPIPIVVYEAPKISDIAGETTIQAETGSTTLSVTFSGTSPFTCEWQEKEKDGSDWKTITGTKKENTDETTSSYTLSKKNVADTGKQYRCVVTHTQDNQNKTRSSEAVSTPVTLNVTPIPIQNQANGSEFTETFQDETIQVGKYFTTDAHAGECIYTLLQGNSTTAGEGELDAATGELTVNKTGTFVIGMRTVAKGNYAEGELVQTTLTVEQGKIVSSVEGYSADYDDTAMCYYAVYDGKPHGIQIQIEQPSGAVITYSTDGVNYSTEGATFMDAQTKTIYYKINKKNYIEQSGSVKVEIKPMELFFTPKDQVVPAGEELDQTAYTYTGMLGEGDQVSSIDFTSDPQSYQKIYTGGTISLSNVTITNKDRGDVTGNYIIGYAQTPATLTIVHNTTLPPSDMQVTVKHPEKIYLTTDYQAGQTIKLEEELAVTVSYDDGYEKVVKPYTGDSAEQPADTYTTNAASLDMTKEGTKELTITYQENGGTKEETVTLIVKAPPTLDTGLSNQTVEAGKSVKLEIKAQGSATLIYQWAQWNESAKTWEDIAGATQTTYTTPVLKVSDNGTRYQCTVTNDWGTITTATTLTVEAVPVRITGTDVTLEYYDNMKPLRINDYFEIDPNAGARTYTLETQDSEAAALSEGDDPILTVTRPGTFVITLQTEAKDDIYAAAAETITVTVKKGVIRNTVTGFEGVYDAQTHQIHIQLGTSEDSASTDADGTDPATGENTADEDTIDNTADEQRKREITGVTITYSLDDKEYSAVNPEFTDAGEYTVFYKLEKDNYETVTGSQTVKIAHKPITLTAVNQTILWNHELEKGTGAYTISDGGLVSGHELERVTVEQSTRELTQNGSIVLSDARIVQPVTADRVETDVTKNYAITYVNGVLTIEHDSTLPPKLITAVRAVTVYKVNCGLSKEDFEKDITVTVQYEDGYSKTIQEGFVADASAVNTAVPGVYPISISYTENGVTCRMAIDITITEDTVATVTKKQQKENAVVMNTKTSVKWSGSTVTLKWGKVEGADGYDIYAALDGKSYKNVEVSVTGGSKTSAKLSKVSGKKLSASKIYKIRVQAYRLVGGSKQYIATGQDMCIVGSKHTKYTNAKSIKVTKSSYKLKKGKTAQIKASITKQDKNKALLPSQYGKSLKYASTNEKIATVTAKGKVKAKSKGTCYIYVTALNGVNKKIKITVK